MADSNVVDQGDCRNQRQIISQKNEGTHGHTFRLRRDRTCRRRVVSRCRSYAAIHIVANLQDPKCLRNVDEQDEVQGRFCSVTDLADANIAHSWLLTKNPSPDIVRSTPVPPGGTCIQEHFPSLQYDRDTTASDPSIQVCT